MFNKPSGVEIKTYVVLNAKGQVMGVRLTKASALSLFLSVPKENRGAIQPHVAHKRV